MNPWALQAMNQSPKASGEARIIAALGALGIIVYSFVAEKSHIGGQKADAIEAIRTWRK